MNNGNIFYRKEEAIEDFKKKFVFVMAELKSFENKLLTTSDIEI